MKWYGSAPGASMHMHDDPELQSALKALFRGPVNVVIETGTYDGTGSTSFIANALRERPFPKVLHTIEVNATHWAQAKHHLAGDPAVHCHWGCSVEVAKAIEFMAVDPAIQNPEVYPEIWCDHMENAATHYAGELGAYVGHADDPDWEGEGLLEKLLIQYRDDKPLVVLDSAGGIGLMEFAIMMHVMDGREFFVLLDDVHHVKHFRSLSTIRGLKEFRVLGEGQKWALAHHELG